MGSETRRCGCDVMTSEQKKTVENSDKIQRKICWSPAQPRTNEHNVIKYTHKRCGSDRSVNVWRFHRLTEQIVDCNIWRKKKWLFVKIIILDSLRGRTTLTLCSLNKTISKAQSVIYANTTVSFFSIRFRKHTEKLIVTTVLRSSSLTVLFFFNESTATAVELYLFFIFTHNLHIIIKICSIIDWEILFFNNLTYR